MSTRRKAGDVVWKTGGAVVKISLGPWALQQLSLKVAIFLHAWQFGCFGVAVVALLNVERLGDAVAFWLAAVGFVLMPVPIFVTLYRQRQRWMRAHGRSWWGGSR